MASHSIYITEAEKPTIDLEVGDTCYIINTGSHYKATTTTDWALDTTSNTPIKRKIVRALSDFPTPISDIITLEDGVTYLINGAVDIGINRFVCGVKNSFIGGDRVNDKLTSTTTGVMFTMDGTVTTKSNILFADLTIGCPNGTLLNVTSPTNNQAIGMVNLTISATANMGTVNNISTWAMTNCVMRNTATSSGFNITGTNGTTKCRLGVFSNNVGTLFNFGTSVHEVIDFNNNQVLCNASQVFISGTTGGANVTVHGKLNDNIFSGAGTFIQTVTTEDWAMNGNVGAANTSSGGGYDGNPNTIVQDSTHRFATDSEKTAWNAAQSGAEAYADGLIASLKSGSPATLDTLDEIATALGDDPNFSTTILTALGNRVRVDISNQGLSTQEKTNAKTNLGIENINNTSDANKPVSTATQTALDGKAATSHTHAQSDVTGLVSSLAALQPTLVSGTNIKTINGSSILGSGDLVVGGGSVIGYTIPVQALTSSPVDATTMYFGTLPKAPVTVAATSKIYIRKAGTIKIAEIYCYSGTAGTAEAWSLYIRKNNTTDTLIQTLSLATSERIFTNSSLSIAVIAGDYIEIKAVNPTWVTNPLTTIFGGYIYIE